MSKGDMFKMDSASLGNFNFSATTMHSYQQHMVGQMQHFNNGFLNPVATPGPPNQMQHLDTFGTHAITTGASNEMQHLNVFGSPAITSGASNQMQHLNTLANAVATSVGASNQMQNLNIMTDPSSFNRMQHLNIFENVASTTGTQNQMQNSNTLADPSSSNQMQHVNALVNAAAASGASAQMPNLNRLADLGSCNQMKHLNILANPAAESGASDQMQNLNRPEDPGSSNQMQHLNVFANPAAASSASDQMPNVNRLADPGSCNQMKHPNILAAASGASDQMKNLNRPEDPGSSNQMQHLNVLANPEATSSPLNQMQQNLNTLANPASDTANQTQQMTVLANPANAGALSQPENEMQQMVNPAGQPQPAPQVQNQNCLPSPTNKTSGSSLPHFGSLNFNRPMDASSTVHNYNLRTKRAPSVVEIDDIDDDLLFDGNLSNHQVMDYSPMPLPLQQQSEINHRQQQRQRGQAPRRSPQQRTRGGGSRGGGRVSRGSTQTRLRPVAPRTTNMQFNNLMPMHNYGQQNVENPYPGGVRNQMALSQVNRQHYLGGNHYQGSTTIDLTQSQEPHLVTYNGGTMRNRNCGTRSYGAPGSSTFHHLPTNSFNNGNSLLCPQGQNPSCSVPVLREQSINIQPSGYSSRSTTPAAAAAVRTTMTSGINPTWAHMKSEYSRPSSSMGNNNRSLMLSQGQNHSIAVSALKKQLQNQSRNIPPCTSASRSATPSAVAGPVTTRSNQPRVKTEYKLPSRLVGSDNSLLYPQGQNSSCQQSPLRKQLINPLIRNAHHNSSASRSATPSAAAAMVTSWNNSHQPVTQVKTDNKYHTMSAPAATVNSSWNNNNQPTAQVKTGYNYYTSPLASAATLTSLWNNNNQPMAQVKSEYKYQAPSATVTFSVNNNQPERQVKSEHSYYPTNFVKKENCPQDYLSSTDLSSTKSVGNTDMVIKEQCYSQPDYHSSATNYANHVSVSTEQNNYPCCLTPGKLSSQGNIEPRTAAGVVNTNGNNGTFQGNERFIPVNNDGKCGGENLTNLNMYQNQNAFHRISQGNEGFNPPPSDDGKCSDKHMTDLGKYANQNSVCGMPKGSERFSVANNDRKYTCKGMTVAEGYGNQNVNQRTLQGMEGFSFANNDRKYTDDGMTRLNGYANQNMIQRTPQGNGGFKHLSHDRGNTDKHSTGVGEHANQNTGHGTPQGNEVFNDHNVDRQYIDKGMADLDNYMAECYKAKLTGQQQAVEADRTSSVSRNAHPLGFRSLSPLNLDSFLNNLGTGDIFDTEGCCYGGSVPGTSQPNHMGQPSSGYPAGVDQTNYSQQNQHYYNNNNNYGSQQTNNVFPPGQGGNCLVQNVQNNVTYNVHQVPYDNRSGFWNTSQPRHFGEPRLHPQLPTSFFAKVFMPWGEQGLTNEPTKPPLPSTDGTLSESLGQLGAHFSQVQNVVNNQNYFDVPNYGLLQGQQALPPSDPEIVNGNKSVLGNNSFNSTAEPKYPEIDLTES